jgi:hypothetical protein
MWATLLKDENKWELNYNQLFQSGILHIMMYLSFSLVRPPPYTTTTYYKCMHDIYFNYVPTEQVEL